MLGPKLLVYKVSWSPPIRTIFMIPFQDHSIVPIIMLEKTLRPGNIRRHLRIKAFPEDPSLCPVRCLVEYSDRINQLNLQSRTSLFVPHRKPHASVTPQTLARWMMDILSDSGVNTAVYKAHSTRSAAGTHLSKTLNVQQICKLANWSTTSGTYEKFYLRYL